MERKTRVICGCAGVNRYGILVLGSLFLAVNMSAVIAYNASFVAMMDKKTSPLYELSLNTSEEIDWESPELSLADRRFSFDTLQKSLSFAGAFAGALVGTQPINLIIMKFGAHKTMIGIGIMSTVAAALTPVIVGASFPVFVILRFIAGMGISNLFPVAGIIVNEWAPLAQRGFFVAMLSGHVELSPMFTMPASAIIATSVSWPMVFYVHAALTGILTLLWAIYYRDQPSNHPFVSNGELAQITYGKAPKSANDKKKQIPFRSIFSSLTIWAIWIAVIGNFFVLQFAITFAPMYLSYVLGYSTNVSGWLSIIPMVIQLVIKFFTGLVSDKLKMKEVSKVRMFNTIGLLGSGIFFIVITIVPPQATALDVILLVIPVALLGFHAGGYPKCAVIVSQQHSATVMSVVQMMACLSLLGGSFVVPALTPTNAFNEWRSVFALYAALLVFSNTVFVLFAKGEPAKWTQDADTEQVIEDEHSEDNSRAPSPDKCESAKTGTVMSSPLDKV